MNERQLTAWDLAGDWSWMDTSAARVVGGRTLYEKVTASKTMQTCLLQRLTQELHGITRYIDPMTPMELVRRVE